jgi:hypothetical protein
MSELAIRAPRGAVVSPELALVDPELREHALAVLPRVEPFEFLHLRDIPLQEHARKARRLAAALAYLLVAIVRTCAFDACVFASVTAVVLLLSLLG